MIINVDLLKKINESVKNGSFMTVGEVAESAGFDSSIVAGIAGDLSAPMESLGRFFEIANAYVNEINNRVKMLSECYNAIRKWQLEKGLISEEDRSGWILWEDKLSGKEHG